MNFDKTQVVWIGIKKYSSQTIKTKWKLNWGKTDFKILGIHFHVDLDNMSKINFKEKICKMKNILKLWNRRYLTPLGKITVIKTLLLPILNHLFISLPNPKEDVIKEFNTMFFNFLWSATAKIKQSVLVKQYIEGGLKMINLKAFILSLKATWIRRLLRIGGNWTGIIENDLNIKNFINYGNSFAEIMIHKISNKFWQYVLKSHTYIMKNNQVKSLDQFLRTPIFQKDSLLIGGMRIINKTWNDKGIYLINDLVSEKGELYAETDFKKVYNIKTNFLQFNGIIQAINTFARNNEITLNNLKLQNPSLPYTTNIYLKSIKGCKDFYNILNNNEEKTTSKIKWDQIYNFSNETWEDIYLHVAPFKYKFSSSLQWFQIRTIHRILPTKKYLHTSYSQPTMLLL